MSDPDLSITADLVVPAGELRWRFGPSGGPGGQHANRAHTRAELSFDLAASPSIPQHLKERMMDKLAPRLVEGTLTVAVDESRSQWRNRQLARRRLADLLREAAARPAPRRPTKPTLASRLRRRREKQRRGEVKRLRRPPDAE